MGLLNKNPALRAAVPKRRRPVMTVWTPEQASAFLDATTCDGMQACWLLALSTGMRRGEPVGLSWSDLDLERGRLQVTTQRTTDSDCQVVTKTPKASSRRAVALAAHTVAALPRHSAGLARERLAAGPAWTDSGLVFVDEVGRANCIRNGSPTCSGRRPTHRSRRCCCRTTAKGDARGAC